MKPDGSLTHLEMWSYWRDTKGFEYALEGYYQETLAKDPLIRYHFLQTKIAKDMINKRMQELAVEENKLNGWDE